MALSVEMMGLEDFQRKEQKHTASHAAGPQSCIGSCLAIVSIAKPGISRALGVTMPFKQPWQEIRDWKQEKLLIKSHRVDSAWKTAGVDC